MREREWRECRKILKSNKDQLTQTQSRDTESNANGEANERVHAPDQPRQAEQGCGAQSIPRHVRALKAITMWSDPEVASKNFRRCGKAENASWVHHNPRLRCTHKNHDIYCIQRACTAPHIERLFGEKPVLFDCFFVDVPKLLPDDLCDLQVEAFDTLLELLHAFSTVSQKNNRYRLIPEPCTKR